MLYVTGHAVNVQVLGNDCLPAHADTPVCPADFSIAAYQKAAPASECACDWQSSLVQGNAQAEQHNAHLPAHANDRASWQAAVKLPEPALPKVAWWQEPQVGKADELVRQIQVGAALTIVTKTLMAAPHC